MIMESGKREKGWVLGGSHFAQRCPIYLDTEEGIRYLVSSILGPEVRLCQLQAPLRQE